jgi:hypothetical protein
MGGTHVASALAVGVAVAPLLGQHTPVGVMLVAVVVGGWALVPDLDHPSSTASRVFGPVTRLVSWLLRAVSRSVYAWTKGPRDEPCKGEHRHLSHTAVFAAALGYGTRWLTGTYGRWAVAGVVLFGVILATEALGDWIVLPPILAGSWWAATDLPGFLAGLDGMAGWIGYAVALGCFVHCLGDALTESGCPFLWPLPIAGETWYEIRPPALLRFHTDCKFERRFLFPAFLATALVLLVWPYVTPLISRLSTKGT